MASAEIPSEFDFGRFFSSFIEVAKAVLIAPKGFFATMARQGPFINPVTFMVLCVVTHTILATLLNRIEGLVFQNLFMGVTLPFLTAGIFFLILTRLFNSPGTYEATFRINAYASAVGLITWIPVIGTLLELYRLYILVVGLRAIYTIKTSRAAITILITLIVYTVIFKVLHGIAGGQLIKP